MVKKADPTKAKETQTATVNKNKEELKKAQKKMSIDSKNSKASQEKDLEESEKEISEISDENESMEIVEQNENINKRSRIAQANKDIEALNNNDKNTGVIYIGHLPWGFEEKGIKKYFSQFGTITRIMIPRSRKSGRVKGFAFVEFDDMEVAEIAAKTMDNYILFDRSLKCSVVTDTSRYNLLFKKCKKKFQFHNKYNQYLFEKNKPKSKDELKDYVQSLIEKESKKREKIAELGLSYDFPGYKSLLKIDNKATAKAEKPNKKTNETNNIKTVKAEESNKKNKKAKEAPEATNSVSNIKEKTRENSKRKQSDEKVETKQPAKQASNKTNNKKK